MPSATTVTTSVDEVLDQRSGVCQDFAHVMLACLRSHGLPARYVSGYLLTDPPPGRPRLLGADASHAWVAAYSPRTAGSSSIRPTTTSPTGATSRWPSGGDFADVVPLRGVILGGRGQTMEVAVSVDPALASLARSAGPRPRGAFARRRAAFGGMARRPGRRETVRIATEAPPWRTNSRARIRLPADDAELADAHRRRLAIAHRQPNARSPIGPGWFDSSWDLQRGLEVREGWSGDERVRGWVDDFLRRSARGRPHRLAEREHRHRVVARPVVARERVEVARAGDVARRRVAVLQLDQREQAVDGERRRRAGRAPCSTISAAREGRHDVGREQQRRARSCRPAARRRSAPAGRASSRTRRGSWRRCRSRRRRCACRSTWPSPSKSTAYLLKLDGMNCAMPSAPA